MKRIFIVGMARSGTTLLQSMIGSHPEIITFPESHFFSKSIAKKRILRPFFSVGKRQNDFIKSFLTEIDQLHNYKPYKGKTTDLDAWVSYLVNILDELAINSGHEIWLEKTPLHLHYTTLIEKQFPDTLFIHSIRAPLSNISSLWAMSKQYPAAFKQDSLSKAINRYKKEVKLSEKLVRKKNHNYVLHENLIVNPELELRRICNFLDIDYSAQMLDYQKTAQQVSRKKENWKNGNSQTIQIKDKIMDRLSKEEKVYVLKQLQNFKSEFLTRLDTIKGSLANLKVKVRN